MNNEVDVNAVAADVSTQLVKDACSAAFSKVNNLAKSTYRRIFPKFEEHLLDMHKQISIVKIITSQDTPVDFEKVYTPSNFKQGKRIVPEIELVSSILSGKRCILTGNGGAGKTFAMKNMWLEVFRKGSGQVPILVELRKLNSLSTYDIMNFIRLNSFGRAEFDEVTFKHFCEQGAFTFLLDGFDEVSKEKRGDLEKQILELSRRYEKCGLIVSGRPDERFGAWTEFYIYKSEPFGYDQFRELISKVPFDTLTKKAFQRVATQDFFDSHESFLSNPLLSLMMLLTFRDNAEIPSRLSTFYERCFSTLYAQHDALKESFSRKKSLDQLHFKRLFSAFSLITYLGSKPSLNGSELIQTIERAKVITNIDVGIDDAKHDILESVNLLIKEGDSYYYIHRSFQEFFAANCVVSVLSSKQGEMISKFAKRTNDSTLRLTYELHQKLVEDEVVIPRYKRMKEDGNLPQKISKVSPFNAISCSGLSLRIRLKTYTRKGQSGFRYGLYGFLPSWNDDYEILVPTVQAIVDRSGDIQGLQSILIDQMLVKFIRSQGINEIHGEGLDVEGGDILSVVISFAQDSISISVGAEEGGSDIELSGDVEATIRDIVEKSSLDMERKLVEVNKSIVRTCESIMMAQCEHETILDGLGEI